MPDSHGIIVRMEKSCGLPEMKINPVDESSQVVRNQRVFTVCFDDPLPPPLALSRDYDLEELVKPVSRARPRISMLESPATIPRNDKGKAAADDRGSAALDTVEGVLTGHSIGGVSSMGFLTPAALETPPDHLSDVAMTHRTNGWSKHVSTAEAPVDYEPGPGRDCTDAARPIRVAENPAPVMVDDLTRSAMCPETRVVSIEGRQSASSGPLPTVMGQTLSINSKPPRPHVVQAEPYRNNSHQSDHLQGSLSQESSAISPARGLSRPNPNLSPPPFLNARSFRNTSIVMAIQNGVHSPIDESTDTGSAPKSPVSASPPSTSPSRTPLARPNGILFTKPLSLINSPPTSIRNGIASRLSHIHTESALDSLHQQEPRATSRLSKFKGSSPDSVHFQHPHQRPSTRLSSYDSHQPRPINPNSTDASHRESVLAAWRGSIRQEAATSAVTTDTITNHRTQMLAEKQSLGASGRNEKASQVTRGQKMEKAHREALRKLQARADVK